MSIRPIEVYEDEDGWYFLDANDEPDGPYDTQTDAEQFAMKYFANCPRCRGD